MALPHQRNARFGGSTHVSAETSKLETYGNVLIGTYIVYMHKISVNKICFVSKRELIKRPR